MFGKKFNSLIQGTNVENPDIDYKSSKRLGQYRVSGCCAGGVPVERVIFIAENVKVPLIFDSKKQVEIVLDKLNIQK